MKDVITGDLFEVKKPNVDKSGPECGGCSTLNHRRAGNNNLDVVSSTSKDMHIMLERHENPHMSPDVQILEVVSGARNKSMIEALPECDMLHSLLLLISWFPTPDNSRQKGLEVS